MSSTLLPDQPNDEPREAAEPPATLPVAPFANDEPSEPAQPRRPSPMLIGASLVLLVAVGVTIVFATNATSAPGATPTPPLPTPAPNDLMGLPVPSSAIDPATVVARIGDYEITHREFSATYAPGDDPATTIQQMIDLELVAQAARAEGLSFDPAIVEAQLNEIRLSQTDGSDEAFDRFLEANQIESVEELRAIIERRQLVDLAMMEHTITNQVHARHILLASASSEDLAARRTEAEGLISQLEAGADFAALAQEHSDDAGSAPRGGDLGWTPRGLFVEAFEAELFTMEPNEIRLVESQFGWHIVQLIEGPQERPLSDPAVARQWLPTPMGQEAFNESFLPWVESLRQAAEAEQSVAILVDPSSLITSPAP